jgi:hypothetical protein
VIPISLFLATPLAHALMDFQEVCANMRMSASLTDLAKMELPVSTLPKTPPMTRFVHAHLHFWVNIANSRTNAFLTTHARTEELVLIPIKKFLIPPS